MAALLTDADVRFSPGCLRKAVAHAEGGGLDHLTLFPEIRSEGALLKSFVAVFALFFLVGQRPWRAGDPRAEEHAGVGAFNLVRKGAYVGAGTHRAIRMRPNDDIKLAKLLKKAGFRQGAAFGTGLLEMEWAKGVLGAVRGLEKGLFACEPRLEVWVLSASW